MPIELVKECIGKKCLISLMTGTAEFTGIVKKYESKRTDRNFQQRYRATQATATRC